MRAIAVIQGTYYLLTGIWPFLHMASFEIITGSKKDKWLVKQVGLLAVAIGLALLIGLKSGDDKLIGILSAASFVLIDFYYAANKIIAPTYLFDGFIQIFFVALWLVA
jgi:hypothetical protein